MLTLHTAIITHRTGHQVCANFDYSALTQEVADYCRDEWETEVGHSVPMPETNDGIIEAYFHSEHGHGEYITESSISLALPLPHAYGPELLAALAGMLGAVQHLLAQPGPAALAAIKHLRNDTTGILAQTHAAIRSVTSRLTYPCPRCGAANQIVNQCGCDPDNLPTPVHTPAAELREALDYLLTQTVDQDLAHGIELSEGEADARAKALAVLAKTAPLSTFTTFCQECTGSGTIHICSVQAANAADAIEAGKRQCMADWNSPQLAANPEESPWYTLSRIHCLGVAAGNVEILDWKDIN